MSNSMEPPGLVIIIEGREEVDVWFENDNEVIKGTSKQWPFEVQYWFYRYEGFHRGEEQELHVKSSEGEKTYLIKVQEEYHSTYTVILTVMIEGLVFYLMGFRKSNSWIAFIAINLVTQSILNLYINSMHVSISYPIIILLIAEFWVFLAEGIGFPVFVKEKTKGQRALYAIVANSISLIAGGYLLTWLPV